MKNSKITQELEDALIAFRQNVTTSILAEAKGSGLSLPHFEVIVYIGRTKNVTMKDIANLLHITPPSASVLIETLVEKKLIKRIPSSKDRRTVHLSLDQNAHQLIYSLHKKKISMFNKMLSKINDEDKASLIRILNKCIYN